MSNSLRHPDECKVIKEKQTQLSLKYSLLKKKYENLKNSYQLSQERCKKLLVSKKILENKIKFNQQKYQNEKSKQIKLLDKKTALLQKKTLDYLVNPMGFAEGIITTVLKLNFKPNIVIGSGIQTLEALQSLKKNLSCRTFLDATEYTDISQLSNKQIDAVHFEFIQNRIDELIAEVDGLFASGPLLAEALHKRHNNREVISISDARQAIYQKHSLELKRRIHANDADIIMVSLGNDDPKSFMNVIEISKALPENIILVHVGSLNKNQKLTLKNLSIDKHLLPRFHFFEDISNVQLPTFISCADLGIILPTTHCKNIELSWPTSFHDFVAAGVPIFSASLPNIRMHVENKQLGVILDNTNPQKVADTILKHLDRLVIYRRNVMEFRNENIAEIETKKLLAALPNNMAKILYITNKNITHHGRTHRIFQCLVEAEHEILIIASAGFLPWKTANRFVIKQPFN